MSSDTTLTRKAFFEALEERLSNLSAADLRGVLLAMARQIPPEERENFLNYIEPGEGLTGALQETADSTTLLADAEDFAARLGSAMRQRYNTAGGDPETYDEFAREFAELLDRADAAFDLGEFDSVRRVYRLLLEQTLRQDDQGVGLPYSDEVDVQTIVLRYLRSCCEAPQGQEPIPALLEGVRWVRSTMDWIRPSLADLMAIQEVNEEECSRRLPVLIEVLRRGEDVQSDRWLREAVKMVEGTEGLRRLVETEGRKRPHACLDWLAALADSADAERMVAAAREALEILPEWTPLRARAADCLCAAARTVGDPALVVDARWEAFQAAPTVGRLLDLWSDAGESRVHWMLEAVRFLEMPVGGEAGLAAPGELVIAELEELTPFRAAEVLAVARLLGGAWEEAWEGAAHEEPLGWSERSNSQAVVLPFLIARLSGAPAGELPPCLDRVWNRAMRHVVGSHSDADPLQRQLSEALAQAEAAPPLTEDEEELLVAGCLSVIERRVAAIVEGEHLGAYERAASLALAAVEMLELRDKTDRGQHWLDGLLRQHGRKPGVREEFDACRARATE